MLDVINKGLRKNIYSRDDLSLTQKNDLYNRLLMTAQKEIFDYGDHTIGILGEHYYNIRFQTENLIIGWDKSTHEFSFGRSKNKLQRRIIFWQVFDPITGFPFDLPLQKTDFDGQDIFIWRE